MLDQRLEMMWTQVRQLENQQAMIDAANLVIERVQDFGTRFGDVEVSINDAVKKINRLKITTADSGQSIITAARSLLKAGAKENKKKKSIADSDQNPMLPSEPNSWFYSMFQTDFYFIRLKKLGIV